MFNHLGPLKLYIDLSISNNVTIHYMNILYNGEFLPIITLPTWATVNSITLNDHFWMAVGIQVLPGLIENIITNNKFLFLCMTVPRRIEILVKKKIRYHFNQNIVNFQNSAHDYIRDFSTYNNYAIKKSYWYVSCNVISNSQLLSN